MWEFERRGYLKSGGFVPEVVLEHPEMVRAMHYEYVHAGSDVVEAFTVSVMCLCLLRSFSNYIAVNVFFFKILLHNR